MCGLIAMVMKTTTGGIQQDVNVFSDMLYMDALRGWDATGVGMYSNTGSMRMIKEASPAPEVMATKQYGGLMADFIKDGKALIGHNRKATVGKITDETSHPFLINEKNEGGYIEDTPGYMFMHNGTLRNWDKLVEGVKTEVDSEMLGHLLAGCNGDKDKIQEALGNVHGAYACIWFDQTQDNMYIVRNSERPLIMGITAFGVLVSSEIGIMAAAAQRNNCKIEKFVPVDAEVLYSISLEKNSKAEVTEEKLTIKKSMPLTSTSAGRGARTKRTTSGAKFVGIGEEGDVSKNYFKRLRAEYIGSSMGFWLVDFEPRVIGDAACKDWLVFGENEDDYLFSHKFQGVVTGLTEEDLLLQSDTPYFGVVEEVIYNKDDKSVTFIMKKVKPIATSNAVAYLMH